jgi:Holliday junction resolvase RusA-like endonuclease
MTWPGEPRTKKNSARIAAQGNRRIILPSGAFVTYQNVVGWYIPGDVKRLMISNPVNVRCLYYMATRRKVDLLNLLAATSDILVRYGVIADDSADIVASTDGSRVMYDKDNPRAEMEITPHEN